MLAGQLDAAFLGLFGLGACGSLVRVPGVPPVPAEVLAGSFTPEDLVLEAAINALRDPAANRP